MKKRKRTIAYYITIVAAIVWAVGASAIDTASSVPFVACLLSSLWLVLYVRVENAKQARKEAKA